MVIESIQPSTFPLVTVMRLAAASTFFHFAVKDVGFFPFGWACVRGTSMQGKERR